MNVKIPFNLFTQVLGRKSILKSSVLKNNYFMIASILVSHVILVRVIIATMKHEA